MVNATSTSQQLEITGTSQGEISISPLSNQQDGNNPNVMDYVTDSDTKPSANDLQAQLKDQDDAIVAHETVIAELRAIMEVLLGHHKTAGQELAPSLGNYVSLSC